MASKSKSRRRVFRASCILAALIVAGSSFAWFSSKDEVTNRLSASANYGVSIVEDFQPPKNFLPGQKVNKDVAVVNTGNVDAFVRAWIDGEMSLVKKSAWNDSTAANTGTDTIKNFSNDLLKTEDDQTKLTGVNLNWYKGTNYYKELSQIKSENPENATTSTTAADETSNDLARFSEVQSIQAGGVLVYHDYTAAVADDPGTADDESAAATGAEYYYVLEQATTITNNAGETKTYPAGTYVHTPGSCIKTEATVPNDNRVEIPYGYYGNIDTSQFFPESEGLYLFRRNVKVDTAQNAKDDYEYTGYYFFQDTSKYTTTATEKTDDKSTLDKRPRSTYNPVYLALCYDDQHGQRSDYVLPDDKVTTNTSVPTNDEVLPVTLSDVRLYTATEKVLKSNQDSTTTYTANGDAIDEPTADETHSENGYHFKITKGGESYYGATKTGSYRRFDTTANNFVADDDQTVTEVVTANGMTWNYTPYTAAGADTYKIGENDASAPVLDAENAPADTYTWKTVSNGITYWSTAETGAPYYAQDAFSGNALTGGATAYTLNVTPGADAEGGVLYATYGTAGTNDYIRINVQLANLDNAPATSGNAETWSVIKDESGPDKKWTFYYNNDVEEGASTTKLIDYVELDKTVKDEAFLAFDFDLNVFMESAQVVLDEQGNEVCTPIVAPWENTSSTEPGVTNTNFNAATGEKNGASAEIESITWAAYTP